MTRPRMLVTVPGSFTPLYAYEREQPFPWGHRNVVFAQRGGPVVYLKRALYRESPWQDALPVKAGIEGIESRSGTVYAAEEYLIVVVK